MYWPFRYNQHNNYTHNHCTINSLSSDVFHSSHSLFVLRDHVQRFLIPTEIEVVQVPLSSKYWQCTFHQHLWSHTQSRQKSLPFLFQTLEILSKLWDKSGTHSTFFRLHLWFLPFGSCICSGTVPSAMASSTRPSPSDISCCFLRVVSSLKRDLSYTYARSSWVILGGSWKSVTDN